MEFLLANGLGRNQAGTSMDRRWPSAPMKSHAGVGLKENQRAQKEEEDPGKLTTVRICKEELGWGGSTARGGEGWPAPRKKAYAW